jgi:hypothetical protein
VHGEYRPKAVTTDRRRTGCTRRLLAAPDLRGIQWFYCAERYFDHRRPIEN